MGFCGEMRLGRTPEKGTGGSGEGGKMNRWFYVFLIALLLMCVVFHNIFYNIYLRYVLL